jgi:putative phage-type endonuclease
MTASAQSFDVEERRQYIGASEFGAILGLDRYRSRLDVYNEKLGLTAGFAGNRHTERGIRLESIAADYFTETTGRKTSRRNAAYIHKDYPFIVGHIDRKIVGEDAILEIKCPSRGSFYAMQKTGLPDSYIVQAQGYLGLSGYRKLTWLVFCADLWDAAIFEIEFDEKIYLSAVNAVRDFWFEHIVPQNPPVEKAEEKERLEFERVGGDLIIREDEGALEDANMLVDAIKIKQEGETLFELAKERLLERVERVEGSYQAGRLRFYWKSQPGRLTLDKKRLQAEHPELDLGSYEKQGKDFQTFRTYVQGE